MKKGITIVVLTVIIIATFGFAALKAASLGSRNNWFNSTLRPIFIQNRFARAVFSLHNNGDGRYDYLKASTKTVTIELDWLSGQSLTAGTLPRLEREMEEILESEVKIVESSEISNEYADASPVEISKRYRSFRTTKDEAVLYLLVLASNPANPSQIGSTFREDGVIIYTEAVSNLSSRDNVALEFTTILHEFIHQLGLRHVNNLDCIMDESIEIGVITGRIPEELCPEELESLNNIKATIN